MCHGLLSGTRSDQRVSYCQHRGCVSFDRSTSEGRTDSAKSEDGCSIATPEIRWLHEVPLLMTQRPSIVLIGLLFGFALPLQTPRMIARNKQSEVVDCKGRAETSMLSR